MKEKLLAEFLAGDMMSASIVYRRKCDAERIGWGIAVTRVCCGTSPYVASENACGKKKMDDPS
jgi:hypothetical protein